MNATQRLTLTPTQTAASVKFRKATALAHCTHIEPDTTGAQAIVMDSPFPSTGERLLWQALAHVNGYEERPSDAELREFVDADNLRVVEALLVGERAA